MDQSNMSVMKPEEGIQAYQVKITADSKITIEHHNIGEALDIKKWKQPENKRALKPTEFLLSEQVNHGSSDHKKSSAHSKHKDTGVSQSKHPSKHPLSQPALADGDCMPHHSRDRMRAT